MSRAVRAVAALISTLVAAAPAFALPAPAPATPWAQPNGRVYAIARVGGVVYLGGNFTQITDTDGTTVLARSHLAAVSAADGHVLAWNPGANGSVRTLAVSTDGRTMCRRPVHQHGREVTAATGRRGCHIADEPEHGNAAGVGAKSRSGGVLADAAGRAGVCGRRVPAR